MAKEVFKLMFEDEAERLERLFYLSKPQWEVLTRFHKGVDEPSHLQIASELNIPIGTVKSRLSRARDRIIKWRAEDALKATL